MVRNSGPYEIRTRIQTFLFDVEGSMDRDNAKLLTPAGREIIDALTEFLDAIKKGSIFERLSRSSPDAQIKSNDSLNEHPKDRESSST